MHVTADPAETVPEVHERVAALLSATRGSDAAESAHVYALVEADDPGAPILVRAQGAGRGGGRRIVLEGSGLAHVDTYGHGPGEPAAPATSGRGSRPTHLLVRCVTTDGQSAAVLVERGTRGIPRWPDATRREAPVRFDAARLDAEAIVTGGPLLQ